MIEGLRHAPNKYGPNGDKRDDAPSSRIQHLLPRRHAHKRLLEALAVYQGLQDQLTPEFLLNDQAKMVEIPIAFALIERGFYLTGLCGALWSSSSAEQTAPITPSCIMRQFAREHPAGGTYVRLHLRFRSIL